MRRPGDLLGPHPTAGAPDPPRRVRQPDAKPTEPQLPPAPRRALIVARGPLLTGPTPRPAPTRLHAEYQVASLEGHGAHEQRGDTDQPAE
jgi:hypothetical protein